MLKIAFCDDDTNAINKYAELISNIAKKHQVEIELLYFDSGVSLMSYYMEVSEQLDIIYLDIQMDTMNGLDTACKLREKGFQSHIVFLTNFEEYVFNAFDVKAENYLLKKDFSSDKFEEVFLKIQKLNLEREKKIFSYSFAGNIKIVDLQKIAYFEIWKNRIAVHLIDGVTDRFYDSMDNLEQQLKGKCFIRVHRSYLVPLSSIAMFRNNTLLLKTGEKIPIGTTYIKKVEKLLSEYIANHHVYFVKNSKKEQEE